VDWPNIFAEFWTLEANSALLGRTGFAGFELDFPAIQQGRSVGQRASQIWRGLFPLGLDGTADSSLRARPAPWRERV